MRIRIGKDIKVKWAVLTDGSALPLNKEELTLELAGPNGKSQSMEFEVEGNVLTATFYGKDQNYTGDYMLTLWKNKGKEGQSVVDKTSAFSLVRYTPQEDLAQKHDNLSATLADLGDTSLVTIDGASETTLVCNLTGYKAVGEVSDLPMEPSTIGYLVGDNLYVYVGEGGDTLGGKYKNCGPFRGLKGDQGNSGYQGAAGELQVVNNLTDGGETAALSAEQGKVLDSKKQDKLNYYAENDGRAVMQAPYVGMFSSEDTNEGGKESTGLYASKGVASLYYAERDAENKVQHEDGLYLEKRRENGSGCVLLHSYNAGGANSKIQITPEEVSIKGAETVEATAPEVSVKATGGVKFETQGTDSTSAYIEMLGGDEPDLDLHTDSNLTIFGNNSVAIESDNNISVTANSNIDLSATDNISMSSQSGEIKDVVGALVSNANAIATLNGTGDGSVSKKVTDEIAKIVDSAPEAFDTLKEIADYITEDMSGAEEIVTSLGALNMRIYELGDFPSSGVAEAKAAEEAISRNPSISIIHYSVNHTTSHIILQDVNDNLTQQVLYYAGNTFIRYLGANLNAKWRQTNPTNIKYNQDSHRIALMHMVNQYGEGDNNIDWVELPTATTTKDGLMTKEQVKSLEGKQDALQTYEETTGKAEVKMPNGNSYVRVTKDGAGMYAQDGKSGIVNSSSGLRLVYMETATDSSGDSYTSHRDDISIGKHSENSATHITLTSKSTTEAAGEKITNTSTIQVNPYGISMSSPNGEIGDIVKEISEKASSESVSELRQEVEDKAPKVGYAPDLKVNFAKELVGRGEATEEVIGGIRPTGVRSIGDGNATITKIKGESIVWNQCIKISRVAQVEGLEITKLDDNTFRINGTCSKKTHIIGYNTDNYPKNGTHYNVIEIKHISGTCSSPINIYNGYRGPNLIGITIHKGLKKNWTTNIFHLVATEPTTFDNYTFSIYCYDLTQMFGAGNEPTTIEEFEARKPLNVTNEYNEGTIVSYEGDALKSVGFNAFNGSYAKVIGGEEYHAAGTTSISFAKELDGDTTAITLDSENKFIPEEDGYVYAEGTNIVIHLTHSYTPDHVDEYEEDVHPLPNVPSILDAEGNQLFPYGLLSAGSVHDEITATKAVKRVGVVDMGTLSWKYGKNNYWPHELHYAEVATAMPKSDFQSILVRYTKGESVNKITDKQYASGAANRYIYIYDSSYTSASDFKQSMSGVRLYYELAEPIEVDLPEPLNMTYEAWDFGTEELVAKGATTPLNADIVYQFNAVDRIRENSSAIDGLEEHVEEHKDDGIELLTNGNLKLTLKGITKEFMPATPSGDPMHWAYVSAGAEYNATDGFILKDAPWKDMVDTIEDKAKWSLDVVDASNVQQMTIKGVEYNYATENRTSPEGGTYLRYFIVGKGSNGFWVEDETKVLHLPKCWYLNGLGDITNAEMLRCYEESPKNVGDYVSKQFGKWSKARTLNARISAYSVVDVSYLFVSNENIEVPNILWTVYNISNMFLGANRIRYVLNIRYPSNPSIGVGYCNTAARIDGAFSGATSLRGCFLSGLVQSVSFSGCGNISKPSILKAIKNATPSSAITITLHADAYARLAEDADIVAALEAKPLVTLVSA